MTEYHCPSEDELHRKIEEQDFLEEINEENSLNKYLKK